MRAASPKVENQLLGFPGAKFSYGTVVLRSTTSKVLELVMLLYSCTCTTQSGFFVPGYYVVSYGARRLSNQTSDKWYE